MSEINSVYGRRNTTLLAQRCAEIYSSLGLDYTSSSSSSSESNGEQNSVESRELSFINESMNSFPNLDDEVLSKEKDNIFGKVMPEINSPDLKIPATLMSTCEKRDKSEMKADNKESYLRVIKAESDRCNFFGEMEKKNCNLQVKERFFSDKYSFSSRTDRSSGWGVRGLAKDIPKNEVTCEEDEVSAKSAHSKQKSQYSNSNRGDDRVKLERYNDRRASRSHPYDEYSRRRHYGWNENRDTRRQYWHYERRYSRGPHRDQIRKAEADRKYSRHYRDYRAVSRSYRSPPPKYSRSRGRRDDFYDTYRKDKRFRAEKDVTWSKHSSTSYKDSSNSLHRYKDVKAPSHVRNEANNALKEAEELKRSAYRLKGSGFKLESTELFFQAALKYLHEASQLEKEKYVEMPFIKIYESTAKLLEYCGQEYESCNYMASAALAYKCVEVSYMRIIYSINSIVSSNRNDLQVALQASPSEDSSKVGNVKENNYNNEFGEDFFLNSRDHSKCIQLINFTQYASCAMEASTKSQSAFTGASKILEEKGRPEVAGCIKEALDYCFHNMEEMLKLVEKAKEASLLLIL